MNLNSEIRNGYTISSDMKKVWNIQMKMVVKLIEVCNKYNLKVWADGGTLLGTVRDHGYIPWDDDIDMVMLRDDYNKLLQIAPTEFQEPFFFQNVYTDKKYPRGHSQLRYNGTAAILPCDVNCAFNQSIFIDIFVYDQLPKDKSALLQAMRKAEHYRGLLYDITYGKISLSHPKVTIKYLLSKVYFAFNNFIEVYNKFQRCYTDYKTKMSNVVSCPMFCFKFVFDIQRKKEWYADTILMPFEDIQMPVPIGYDEILRNQYGDYMTPVKAPSLHGGVIFDTERPYTEVLKDIKSGKIDIKKYLNE